MLLRTAYLNTLLDRLTGRNTSAGTITADSNTHALYAYTGSQLGIDSGAPSAYERFGTGNNPRNIWASAAGGVAAFNSPIAQDLSSGSPSGTLTFMKLHSTLSGFGVMDISVGLAGSGAECILDSVTANGASSGINIVEFDLKLVPTGDMKVSTNLLNTLLDILLRGATAPQMGTGVLKAYTGSAPASADDPATGTELISFAPSAAHWAFASGRSVALASFPSATAIASGTAGYMRWTKDSYTIQGSVDTAGATFLMDSVSLTNGLTYDLTGVTISL